MDQNERIAEIEKVIPVILGRLLGLEAVVLKALLLIDKSPVERFQSMRETQQQFSANGLASPIPDAQLEPIQQFLLKACLALSVPLEK